MNNKFRRGRRAERQLIVKVSDTNAINRRNGPLVRWSQIAANSSQVLMLLAVAFGYWFGVRPVLQNQLLQEKNAELELAVREKQEAVNLLTAQIQGAKEQLLSFQWARFIEELRGKATRNNWMATDLLHPDDSTFDLFALEVRGSPDPYTSLRNALEEMQAHQTNASIFPEQFFDIALAHIENQRDVLSCQMPDLKSLGKRYGDELAGISKGGIVESYEAAIDIRDSLRGTAISMLEVCEGKINKAINELELRANSGSTRQRN